MRSCNNQQMTITIRAAHPDSNKAIALFPVSDDKNHALYYQVGLAAQSEVSGGDFSDRKNYLTNLDGTTGSTPVISIQQVPAITC